MELEHIHQQPGALTAFQLLFAGSLLVLESLGRADICRALASALASLTVTFGPMAVLLYILYRVSSLG